MLTKSPWAFQYVHTNFLQASTEYRGQHSSHTEGRGKCALGTTEWGT
jgi:hypothetical protein